MPPSGLQLYLRPYVTLTFNLLIPKVNRFMSLLRTDHLRQFASNLKMTDQITGSWAQWDWPLTWLTNHRPSVLWHCWLGRFTDLTRKIVSEITYSMSSGTLNPTIPYHSIMSNSLSDPWLTRLRYYSTSNNSKMVQDRAILTMADQ